MFRFIIDDTRALLNDIKTLMSRLAKRWQWFRLRSKNRLDAAAADLENVKRAAEAASRMCSACRALIPAAARVCPECGEVPGRRVSRGASRLLENMIPGVVSISSGILTANVVLYAFSLMVWSHLDQTLPPDMRPGAWNLALIALGANVPNLVIQGEVWRLLTSVFLHGGALHLLFNSWALLSVGPLIEEIYGKRKYIFIYVTTGIGASFVSTMWRAGSWTPGIGASGALFGLIGLAAVWGWRHGGRVGQGIRAQMIQWALYVLVLGFLFRFDNAAHIGGMISGALMGLIVTDRESSPGAMRVWEALGWLCGLLVVASFLIVAVRYGPTIHSFFEG